MNDDRTDDERDHVKVVNCSITIDEVMGERGLSDCAGETLKETNHRVMRRKGLLLDENGELLHKWKFSMCPQTETMSYTQFIPVAPTQS